MKSIIRTATLALSVLAISLGTANAQKKVAPKAAPAAKTTAATPVELYWLDLTPAGINAEIQVPTTVKIITDPYDVIIGDGKNIFIEITNTSQSFDEVKSFVAKNDIRGFVKFTLEEANGFIAQMKAFGQTEFDFSYYATIGSDHFLLKDPGKYHHASVDIIKAMYGYAKTIKAK